MNKISVIIPIYNTGLYLSECIDCIINQTLKDIEIILINDGSYDNSEEICLKYKDKYSNIKYYYQENQGASVARNKGLEIASGEFIYFMDSDDTINDKFLETSYNIAVKEKSDIVITSLNIVNWLNIDKSKISWISTCQMFVRKSFLDKHNDVRFIPNMFFGEDPFLAHSMLMLTDNISKNSDAIYHYRRHYFQTSQKILREKDRVLKTIEKWLHIYKEFYDKNKLWKIKEELLLYLLCDNIFWFYLCIKWNNKEKELLFNLIHVGLTKK